MINLVSGCGNKLFPKNVRCQEILISGKMNRTYIHTSLTCVITTIGLTTLLAQRVSILRAKLLKVVIMVSSSFGTLPLQMSSPHFSLSPPPPFCHAKFLLFPSPKNVFHI